MNPGSPLTPEAISDPAWLPWARAIVWNGDNGEQCGESDDAEHRCDLLVDHAGPHFYVLDHDADGDPSWIATWPVSLPLKYQNPESESQ